MRWITLFAILNLVACGAEEADSPECGNGILEGNEVCDDGRETAVCNADCTPAVCGDAKINTSAGEECDDGNVEDTDACLSTCYLAKCGDDIVWSGEEICDDGIDNGTISIATYCTFDCSGTQRCGNGEKEGTEFCDLGNANTDSWTLEPLCKTTCDGNNPHCGDGVVDIDEDCDDGNLDNNDGCPDGEGGTCAIADCYDGFLHFGFETDVDCGSYCSPCATGEHCYQGTDCISGNCLTNQTCS